MDLHNQIMIVAGIIFLCYTIMAGAYWNDMKYWTSKLKSLKEGGGKEYIERNVRNATVLFKLCTGMMIFTIIIVILPLYLPYEFILSVCKWIILFPTVSIIFMCLRYVSGKYYVDVG